MSLLHNFSPKDKQQANSLSTEEIFSIYYHNIFDYPLSFSELVKWTSKKPPKILGLVDCKNSYFFMEGRGGLVYKRVIRKRYSKGKIRIAQSAAKIISFVPGVKMIGLTGSLAMENADKDSDIDLVIITRRGRLWSTRLLTYVLLKIANFRIRNPKNSDENNKLCLNMWLDESDISWPKKDRNFYTAHEILQIVPLFDKNGTYNLFLSKNKWALDFWPNAVDIKKNNSTSYTKLNKLSFIENLAFRLQFLYMKQKITRETVQITKAIFHPIDLSSEIVKKYALTRDNPID